MSLYHHLLDTRTREDLARLLVATAKENAELRNQVQALRHEVFWLKVEVETNSFEATMRRMTDLMMESMRLPPGLVNVANQPAKVAPNWNHDVATHGEGGPRHVILRHKNHSLCTQVNRGMPLRYVGAWDDGEPPTCENCCRVWAQMRREENEPNNYWDPDKS